MRSIIAVVIVRSSIAVLGVVAGIAVRFGVNNMVIVWAWIRIWLRVIGLRRTVAVDDDDRLRLGAACDSDHGSYQHRRSRENGSSCVSHFDTPPVAQSHVLECYSKIMAA